MDNDGEERQGDREGPETVNDAWEAVGAELAQVLERIKQQRVDLLRTARACLGGGDCMEGRAWAIAMGCVAVAVDGIEMALEQIADSSGVGKTGPDGEGDSGGDE